MGIRDDIILAMYEVDWGEYQPSSLPPVSPQAKRAACRRLGLPEDAPLTEDQFLEALRTPGEPWGSR